MNPYIGTALATVGMATFAIYLVSCFIFYDTIKARRGTTAIVGSLFWPLFMLPMAAQRLANALADDIAKYEAKEQLRQQREFDSDDMPKQA